MNKKLFGIIVLLLSINIFSAQELITKTTAEATLVTSVQYPYRLQATDELQPISKPISIIDIILPPIEIRCSGVCRRVDMNFKYDSSFSGSYNGWTASHGSPSVGPGYAWMWSYNNRGEGMNYSNYQFSAGLDYCIEVRTSTNTRGSASPHSSAVADITLTTSAVKGTVTSAGGATIPAKPSPNQTLWRRSFSSLPDDPSVTQRQVFFFTANNNYNNIWFHPESARLPQVELNLREVVICYRPDPCDFKIRAYSRQYCNFVRFYSAVSFASGNYASIVGYVWTFGDGNTSNEANPTHVYANSGAYTITLSVTVTNKQGKCCTKRFYFRIKVEACDPCSLLKYANIKITREGSLLKYEPTLPHNNYYIYKWTFADGTTSTSREVYKTTANIWVRLEIYYLGNVSAAGQLSDCCKRVITRRHFIKLDLDIISLDPIERIEVIEGSDSDILAQVKQIANEEDSENNEIVQNDIVEGIPPEDAPAPQ